MALDGTVIAERLRAGTLTDQEFDALYPARVRDASASCWSPLAVVRVAVDLLRPARKILDVGSGCGKLCVAGSVLAPEIAFSGVERRSDLVAVAREAAALACGDGASLPVFHHGDLSAVLTLEYDGLYFYNPFEANVYDRSVAPGADEAEERRDFLDGVRRAERILRAAPLSARVVTCNGFGGEFPASFRRHVARSVGQDHVELWVRDDDAARYPRAVETVPAGLDPEVRARMLVDRYLRLPVTRQGRIGVELGLLTGEEYRSCSRGRVDQYVLERATQRCRMHDLERLVYRYGV